jgi:hypothetical protein
MPVVYITYDPKNERLLRYLITMPRRRFKYLPVVPIDVDGAVLDTISQRPEFYIHQTDFDAYLSILRSLDSVPDNTAVPAVVNISLSPGPGRFEPREPINTASRLIASRGHVLVFAAGNDGPKPRSLSPWSKAPWVIGVGAATENGDALLNNSSIGDPNDPSGWPTVVAPGRTTVPIHEDAPRNHGTMVGLVLTGSDRGGRNLPGYKDVEFVGTSVSAPKVARICGFIIWLIRIFLSLDLLLKKRIGERAGHAHAACSVVEQVGREIVERDSIEEPGFGIFENISPQACRPMIEVFMQLSRRGAYPAELRVPGDATTPFPTSVMKTILKAMARPILGLSSIPGRIWIRKRAIGYGIPFEVFLR